MTEKGVVLFRHYPCLKLEARRKRRKSDETFILAYNALVLFEFLLHYIAEDTPFAVAEILLCPHQLFVHALRDNRQRYKLRMFMFKRRACRLSVIFKYKEI